MLPLLNRPAGMYALDYVPPAYTEFRPAKTSPATTTPQQQWETGSQVHVVRLGKIDFSCKEEVLRPLDAVRLKMLYDETEREKFKYSDASTLIAEVV